MRRILLLFALLAVSWTACSRSDSKPRVAVVSDGSEQQFAQPQAITLGGAGNPGAARLSVRSTGQPTASDAKPSSLEPANRALYDEAMSAALGFLADRKPDQALTKFEAARALLDNDLVNAAVRTVRQRLEVEGAADQVAADVETILEEGRADEAAKLGASALLQFGDTAARERITRLVRQAYSLVTTQTADRQARFKNEFEAAQKQHNLRAAVLALEETLQNGADPGVNQQLIDIRGTLRKYDELRVAAADLRRDPTRLEQSLATLRAAAKLWDTPGVQQEIAEVLQLLQNRRDRLAVVDFEVRGDVGIPRAGAYMADELMPHLKARYDLVDRDQINRIAEDLRAERITDDDLSQQQLGQAAKVQYLIVGSITPVAGFTVQARLVDVKTGLIMQTARIVAADADELGLLVADLAEQLLLNDQQKQLIDSLADQREIPVQVLTPMPVLPPPPEMVQGDVPMPIIPERPKPPLQPRNLQSEDFLQLPPPPEDGSGWRVPALPVERERDLRSRTVFVAVELGDNLFRRGQFREALIRYQFCLPFAPGEVGIRQRIDRCLPLAASAAPEPAIRPRLAIVDFATFGNPLVVTRSLGSWAAQNIAPYFAPNYDPVDRAELLWWMGRLGLTSGDLLADPAARVYLGRALNARYLLLSTLQHTVRFDVTTYLVDAEYGFLAGAGRVHAQRDDELKSCLSELAWLTKLAPDERTRVLRD
ncbi:MAG: hypothetical protein ACJ8F7_16725, partial [Gemmataceae bacterium]